MLSTDVVEKAALCAEDLETLTAEDYPSAAAALESFESAWSSFVRDSPPSLTGETAERIAALRETVRSMEAANESAQDDFHRQHKQILNGQKEMETLYEEKIEEEKKKHNMYTERLKQTARDFPLATEASKLSQEWQRFVEGLDFLAEDYVTDEQRHFPSIHSLVLADLANSGSEDLYERACLVDLQLARAQHDVLQREIDAYERLLPLIEEALQ